MSDTPIHVLECHHAFIKNGRVIQVAVFDGHPAELLEIFRQQLEADLVKCCTDYGAASLYDTWDEKKQVFVAATPEFLETVIPKPSVIPQAQELSATTEK